MRRGSQSYLALVWVLYCSGIAVAQDLTASPGAETPPGGPEAQIAELNTQALEAYQALDIDTAKSKLEEALSLAQQAGITGPTVAQSYMNLAVVYVAGANDRDQGLTAFVSALCMQPDVALDPLLSTPDVQQVYLQAQQDAQGGACGPGSAPPPPPPATLMPTQVGTGPQKEDVECPPGVACNTGGEESGPVDDDFKHFFVDLQLALGSSWVGQGMKADSRPPLNEVIGDVDFVDITGDAKVDAADTVDRDGDGPDDLNGDGMPDNRYYFDNESSWIPDADSFDDLEIVGPGPDFLIEVARGTTPVAPSCKGDGKRSGPIDVKDSDGIPFTTIEPSSYCARVNKEGFVPGLALRLNPGYFITDTFALSLPVRFQFKAGEGSLSHMLIGLRAELLFSKMEHATGVPVSWFFGATYGQIQAKAPPKDPKRQSPYVISGPLGLHTGVNLRIRVHQNFGFIIAPEIDVLLPNFMMHADLSGGIEAAF